MFGGSFQSAVRNLRLYKWRSFLTMLGIIVGVASVVTIVSLGEGVKKQVVGQINQLGSDVITVRSGKVTSSGLGQDQLNLLAFFSTSTLSNNDIDSIKKIPAVSSVVPINFVTNSARSGDYRADNIFVIGTSNQMPDLLNQKLEYGGFFEDKATDEAKQVVVGSKIAALLFRRTNPVGQSMQINGVDFTVIGVLERTPGGLLSIAQTDFNSSVMMSMEAARKLTGNRTNLLQILAKSADPDLDHTVSEIDKTLRKNRGGNSDFTVLKHSELVNIANHVVDSMTAFVSSLAIISLLVGGVGIMSIMLVSVSERTREIGIRKAIGATNRQILNQFLAEGMALSIAGGIIGILVALAINGLLRVYTNLEPVINLRVLILAAAVSVAVGIIFGVAPAIKAARKNPIDALRNG